MVEGKLETVLRMDHAQQQEPRALKINYLRGPFQKDSMCFNSRPTALQQILHDREESKEW